MTRTICRLADRLDCTVMELLKRKEEWKMKKLIKALLLIALGCWIGIHRNVIKAWLTGAKMPEAPASHWWVKR